MLFDPAQQGMPAQGIPRDTTARNGVAEGKSPYSIPKQFKLSPEKNGWGRGGGDDSWPNRASNTNQAPITGGLTAIWGVFPEHLFWRGGGVVAIEQGAKPLALTDMCRVDILCLRPVPH